MIRAWKAHQTEGDRLLFVVPSHVGRSSGIESYWLAVAGLAEALDVSSGGCDVLTPHGMMRPTDLRSLAISTPTGGSRGRWLLRHLPRPVRVFMGDGRALGRNRAMRRQAALISDRRYGAVIQLHKRFQDCGLAIARRLGCPFVLRIEALEIREEAAWGIRRPLWGRWVERTGERRIISDADLVAPVSETLDHQLGELGVPSDRRLVLENGVDLERFIPGPPDANLRRAYGLEDRFVAGWVGGFQPFHGLEMLPAMVERLIERVPNAVICLIGAGPMLGAVRAAVARYGSSVRLIGPVDHEAVPAWIRTFDACFMLAEPGAFHYSPLKLYEYLGCGRPVVAPLVGSLADLAGSGAILGVPAGDPVSVADGLATLASDPQRRTELGRNSRRLAENRGGWDARARQLLDVLNTRISRTAAEVH